MRKGSDAQPITVIPVHSARPSPLELARLGASAPFFGPRVLFLAPYGLSLAEYVRAVRNPEVLSVDPLWFSSQAAYSDLMLQPWLYDRLSQHEVVMVYQLDAMLVEEVPVSILNQLDYLGAPWVPPFRLGWQPVARRLVPRSGRWPHRVLEVGNGGLSLRRVSAFRRVSRLMPKLRNHINEDLQYSFFGPFFGLRVAPVNLARTVFMETEARAWQVGSPRPDVAGFHALEKHNPSLERHLLDEHLRLL